MAATQRKINRRRQFSAGTIGGGTHRTHYVTVEHPNLCH